MTEIQPSSIDAVLFDLDGVVTQTAQLHASAWKRLFDEVLERRAGPGGQFTPFSEDDYLRYVDGKPRYDGVASFLESRGIVLPMGEDGDPPDTESIRSLGDRKNQYFHEVLDEEGAKPYESTIHFVRELRERGYLVGIFSASKNCRAILESLGLTHLFDVRVDGIDAAERGLAGKPDPAMLLDAASQLHVEPGRAAIVEDAESGVRAGRSGGFGLVIGVNRSNGEHGRLLENGADIEVEDLAEIPLPDAKGADAGELPHALAHFDEIAGHAGEGRLAVYFDYDGTLTPIVERPEDAVIDERTKASLQRLAAVLPVSIVSGRDMEDVRAMVGLESVYYAGSHGAEIRTPSGEILAPAGTTKLEEQLDRADAALRDALTPVEGAVVERKRFAIAVHYRQAADDDIASIESTVERVTAEHGPFRVTGGKKIFELRPPSDWDKGNAVRFITAELAAERGRLTPIYIGDDVTDEDAYRVVRHGGIAVVVRSPGQRTQAHFALDSTDEVRELIDRLADRWEVSASA